MYNSSAFTIVTSYILPIITMVCFALAIFFDTKEKNIKNPAAWIILGTVCNFIGFIIYWIYRSKNIDNIVSCQNCHDLYPKELSQCPRCNTTNEIPIKNNSFSNRVKILILVAVLAQVSQLIIRLLIANSMFKLF